MVEQTFSKNRPHSRIIGLVAVLSLPFLAIVIVGKYEQLTANDSVKTIAISQFDPVRDFGDVTQGHVLEARFPIKNIGNHRLVLNQLGSSCECAQGSRETITLQPGESTELIAVLDTHHLEGSFEMEIEYSTSDPEMPRLKLILLSNVQLPDRR